MANFVQLYKSTDTNAPVLTGQVNKVTALLNACLVDGYSTASVTSITKSGTTATYTLASSNATLVTGNYLTISGATGGDAALYNGTYMITVLTGTTGTYIMTSTPSANATGTLLYAKAGLQWTKPFAAGTNAQTYRSADTGSNQFYLQVIDNAATAGAGKEAQIYGAEVMSADQTVTSGQFPTVAQLANGMSFRKSTTADGTARAWTLVGDDRTFYLISNTGDAANQNFHSMGFGHFLSFKPADGYNTFVAAGLAFNSAASTAVIPGLAQASTLGSLSGGGVYVARLYSQTGGSIASGLVGYANAASTGVIGSAGAAGALLTYPNPADSGLYVAQLLISDSALGVRGRMPGYYQPLHAIPFSNYDLSTGVTGLSGVTLTALSIVGTQGGTNVTGQVLVDTFGPWS